MVIGHCCFCCSWFLHVDMKLSQSIIEKTILSPLSYHDTFVKNKLTICVHTFLNSTLLSLCPYANIALYWLPQICASSLCMTFSKLFWLFQVFDYPIYTEESACHSLQKAKILIRIVLKHIEGLHIKICYFNHSVFQTMNAVYFSTYLGLLKFLSSMFRSFCA